MPRVMFPAFVLSLAASTVAFAQDDSAPAQSSAESGDAASDVPAPELPQPFPPQSPEELAYIDELLTHLETKSSQIDRYSADFQRWVTDPVFGPAETFKAFSRGEIRYEAPDKGLFRVDSTGEWTPPAKRGGQPTYPDMGEAGQEQWVCDGESLFEFNYSQKKLVRRELPPELQGGKAIAELPYPLVFGATRETIKARYWLRVATTPEAKARNEYVLEAYPKRREDAGNYGKIEIVIDGTDFLTSAFKIYERNNVETIYELTNRRLNAEESELWRSAFAPKTPAGWERSVEPAGEGSLTFRRKLVEEWEEFLQLFRQPAPIAPAASNEG